MFFGRNMPGAQNTRTESGKSAGVPDTNASTTASPATDPVLVTVTAYSSCVTFDATEATSNVSAKPPSSVATFSTYTAGHTATQMHHAAVQPRVCERRVRQTPAKRPQRHARVPHVRDAACNTSP